MKIKEVMASGPLQYCLPETRLADAAKMMKEANCGALPVIDENKKVVSIITDRDICLSMAKKRAKPVEKITVNKIMPAEVHTVNHNDDVTAAYRQMRTNKIGRLPVVDEHGALKGMVTLHTLLNKSIGDGKKELGTLSDQEENILRTVHAVTGRYHETEKSQKINTAKKTKEKLHMQYEEAL